MLREFTDKEGVQWKVWDINPILHKRSSHPDKRRFYKNLPPAWLCFECGEERRRLTPIPRDWETSDDATLIAYCRSATLVPPLELDFRPGDEAVD